jgi:hypothetical protein
MHDRGQKRNLGQFRYDHIGNHERKKKRRNVNHKITNLLKGYESALK